MTSETQRNHIAWLDYLRLFAALGVIYMHTAASGLRAGVTRGWHLMNAGTSLAFTAVPIFFMISGYLLLSDEKTLRTDVLLRRRLPRLVVPLFGWTVLAALWNSVDYGGFTPGAFLRDMLGALYSPILIPFWFMYTLIAVYLLSPILYGGLHALDKTGHRLVLSLIALVSLRSMIRAFLPESEAHWAGIDLLNKFQALGGYLLEFVLGWYLGNLKRRIDSRLLLAAALLCWAVITIGTWQRTARLGFYDNTFQDQSAGFEVVFASCLFLLAKQNLDVPSRFLCRVPLVPLLLPVYFMHALCIKIFYYLGIDPMRFPSIVGCTLLNFAVSWLAVRTLASIRPFCFLFTGISYQKACRTCNWFFRGGKSD